MYFNGFLFFIPYFVFYVPADELLTFGLDFSTSILAGVVMAASVYGIRNLRKGGNQVKGGIAGIIVALVAGACPCYYLVPLLAVAGGAGGILGVLGIYLNVYQLPIKVLSLVLLGIVAFSLERSLRASCDISSDGRSSKPSLNMIILAGNPMSYSRPKDWQRRGRHFDATLYPLERRLIPANTRKVPTNASHVNVVVLLSVSLQEGIEPRRQKMSRVRGDHGEGGSRSSSSSPPSPRASPSLRRWYCKLQAWGPTRRPYQAP